MHVCVYVPFRPVAAFLPLEPDYTTANIKKKNLWRARQIKKRQLLRYIK